MTNQESIDALVKQICSCKVNLIEHNPIDDMISAGPRRSNECHIKQTEATIVVKVRRSRGKDIDAVAPANKECQYI
jgi:adenine C2-methylase RlmN of 23S rRNA A2503 and tRNA A37